MDWLLVILYLAAGGVFTVLDHLCAHVARSYGKKYPDPFSESKFLPWRLFHAFHFIVLILSFFLILPLICQWFDIHHTSEMLDKADCVDKLHNESTDLLLSAIEEKNARIKELEKALDD